MRVAHVAAEVSPWCATGGLGQVMSALPASLAATGRAEVDAFFPLCRRASAALVLTEVGPLPEGGRLVRSAADGAATYFVDAPHFFDRASLYGEYGDPYPDDAERYSYFNRAVISAWEMTGAPDVAHSHDWHAAAIPEYLGDTPRRPATVLTIHNMAYQGVYRPDMDIGLAPLGGVVNFLASGIANADVVTTVSPTYAQEVLTAGAGLEALLAQRRPIVGILNGIDSAEWDPTTDDRIPENFGVDSLGGKTSSRRALAERMALDAAADDLVVGIVSRLVEQKGIDIVVAAAAEAMEHGARFVVLGDGDPVLETQLRDLANAHPGRFAVHIGWDEGLAHLVIAGSDALAIPSRFEPCGLTQMQAMRYGTVPVATSVGGLRDTVIDPGDDALRRGEGSGIRFEQPTGKALAAALLRAAGLHRTGGWANLQRSIMALDWSWQPAAAAYLDLYEGLLRT